MEIAIFLDENGQTTSIQKSGAIQIFQHNCGVWENSRSMPFCLKPSLGLQAMREYMRAVLDFLGECRNFAALSVSGLPYYELEKAGIDIWEISGSSDNVLNIVSEAEAAPPLLVLENQNPIPVPTPREESPGHYSISLKEIQNCNGNVTSKTVLLPLLQRMNFQTLEVICNHVPPWLEEKILSGQLSGQVDILGNQDYKVTIGRK